MSRSWRFCRKRLYILGFLGCWFLACHTATAQTIKITAPENKEVTPGEFVTLVFRLETPQDLTLEATANSALGWDILRQPGTLGLIANESKPIALTLNVPNTAAATSVETVTLTVGDETPVSVNLTVRERHEIEVQTPVDLILDKDNLTVLLSNRGNVAEEVKLELLATGELVEERLLTLEPLSEGEQVFQLGHEGLYIVKLTNTTGLEITKAVNVIRFGVPEPEPFTLVGEAHASLDTNLSWGTAFLLGGSLSDDWVFDSLLEAPRWRRSFASLDSDSWGVRLGFSATPRPFFSNFPQTFGVSGRYSQEQARLIASFGWLGGSQWSGYIAPALEQNGARVAVGAGISAGQMIAGATYHFEYENGETDLALSYLPGGFNAEGRVETFNIPGKLVLRSGFTHLGERDASFGMQGDYSLDTFIAYAGGTLALGPDAISDYSLGISSDIPADVSGNLGIGVQFSSLSRGATLRYSTPIGNGWQTNNQAGIFFDKDGFGVSLDTHWSVTQQNYLSLDGQFIIRDALPLEGKLGARLEVPFDVVRGYGETEWSLGDQNVGVNAGAIWQNETFALELQW
jgi:hypothetical protein